MGGPGVEVPHGARVLIRMPNWIGDAILCTPALAALRAARPDLELDVLVKRRARAAVDGLPLVDGVATLEGTSVRETLARGRSLKKEGYSAAVVFPKGFREALLVRLAQIPARMGLDTDHRAFLLTHPVPFTESDWHCHHAVQFAKVLEPMGVELADEGLSFPLSDEDRAEADTVVRAESLAGPFAAFHVSASKLPRAWHAGRFGEAARRLCEKTGLRIVLFGTASEARVHDAFKAACPQALDLAGRTSLGGMAALLERCRLFVGNDSGPMHVAAAVGAPVVAVFGPGAPHKTRPYLPANRLRVVYADLPCSPCRQSFWKDCDPSPEGKPPCLEAVSPDAVFRVCMDLLDESDHATG
jgi:lipopolysaccharide heptosyltransferase II